MNNARIESITEKKSFKGALEKGRRCVVLAEGLVNCQNIWLLVPDHEIFVLTAWYQDIYDFLHRFYEWQEVKGGGQKQPYFIYFKENIKQKEKIDVEENDIMLARPLLTMAGIFDVWKSPSVWSMARSWITLQLHSPYNLVNFVSCRSKSTCIPILSLHCKPKLRSTLFITEFLWVYTINNCIQHVKCWPNFLMFSGNFERWRSSQTVAWLWFCKL